MISFSAFVRTWKDVLDSSVNYFFWNEHLNSASRLERVGGCSHNLSNSWQRQQGGLVFGLSQRPPCLFLPCLPVESSMSATPSLQSSCLVECEFVGLGDRVQHTSFCDFCMFVIRWTGEPVGTTLSPVTALAGQVVHRYGPLTDRYRIIGRDHRPVTCLSVFIDSQTFSVPTRSCKTPDSVQPELDRKRNVVFVPLNSTLDEKHPPIVFFVFLYRRKRCIKVLIWGTN